MLSKRGRTLSDEGIDLFLDGMYIKNCRPSKNKIRKFLFSCFHSDWDDNIDKVIKSCRISSMALYGELWEDPLKINKLPNTLDNGISNIVKLILSNDGKKVTKGSIIKNYNFFLSIMDNAYDKNDHQTAMMIWQALTHMSIARLTFKRPKKQKKIFEKISNSYGETTDCYNKHLIKMLESPVTASVDYLPSLIACSIALTTEDEFKKALSTFGHHLNDDMLEEIKKHIQLISVMCYTYRNEKMKLYDTTTTSSSELFELSNKVPIEDKPVLKRTKKQKSNTVKWQDNKMFGKEIPKVTTSAYVRKIL